MSARAPDILRCMSPLELILSAILAIALIYIALVDIREYRIPNLVSYPLIAAGFGLAFIVPFPALLDRALGAVTGFSLIWLIAAAYEKYRAKEGIGLGDAKLTAAAGAWLGWQSLPWVLLAASLTGLIYAFWVGRRRAGFDLQSRLAFGPFLAIGFWIAWIVRISGSG